MSSEEIDISLSGSATASAVSSAITVQDLGYTSQTVPANITQASPLKVTLQKSQPQYYDKRAQALCDLVMKYGYDPDVQMLHGLLQHSNDYVGGLPISPSTFWTTSDNLPTYLALYDYGYAKEADLIKAKLGSLGAFDPTSPNNGQRYEAYAGIPIIQGMPGDEHTILIAPSGAQRTVLTVNQIPQSPHVDVFGTLTTPPNTGLPYKIQSDAWNGQGHGSVDLTHLRVDVQGPQCINNWLRGNLSEAQKIHDYLVANWQAVTVTWQRSQIMFIMRVFGTDKLPDGTPNPVFTQIETKQWSLLQKNGLLPNNDSGGGNDPESQDVLIAYSQTAITNVQKLKGAFTATSAP